MRSGAKIKSNILVLQLLALLCGLLPAVISNSVDVKHEVPGLIRLPDKSLRVQYIKLPDNYADTDDGTGNTVCPDGFTFPKPSTYLELMALKANMPSVDTYDIGQKQFPLGISAIMSGDGSQLLSVDSTTGRIIHRSFWESGFHSKMLKNEIPPTYDQLVLDLKSPDNPVGPIQGQDPILAP